HRRRHDRRDGSQDRTNQPSADLGLRHRPRHNARVLSCLQHVAGLARQMGSASLRPLRDLFIDRRDLHAIFGAMKNALVSAGFGIGIWLSAAVGMTLKLALPGRFDRLAVVLCLLLGWSGVIAYDSLTSAIPSLSLWLLAIGGILYSLGALLSSSACA